MLAGGAIGSPHLLLRSGIGPVQHLEEMGIEVALDLPGVGRNLRDHPQVGLLWRTKEEFVQDESAPRIQFVLRYTAEDSPLTNDMLIHPASVATREPYFEPAAAPIGIALVAAQYLAEGAGELTLASADPNGPHDSTTTTLRVPSTAAGSDRVYESPWNWPTGTHWLDTSPSGSTPPMPT